MWKEKITDVMTQKQAVATKIDENVVSIDEQAIGIDQMIARYHDLLLHLSLLPSTSQLANGVDYRITLEHVEDASSATTRNVQQYQKQILTNPVLAKLEGVLEEYQKAVQKAILSFREEIVKYDVRLYERVYLQDKKQKKETDLQQKQASINALKEQCDKLQKQRDTLVCVWVCRIDKGQQCTSVQQESSSDIDSTKMHMTEVKARITSLKQEIEVLKTRVENAKKDKEKYMLDLIAEEQQTQESIV